MKTTVYYHYPCPDGWVSALAAWLRLRWSASYHGWEAGDHAAALAAQKHARSLAEPQLVYFLDVAPPTAVLRTLLEGGHSVVLLDHHESALRRVPEIKDLEHSTGRLVSVVDTSRSGAWHAWEHFHLEVAPPQLVQYADDRDRWRFALPHARQISAAIGSFPIPSEATEASVIQWLELGAMLEREDGLAQLVMAGETLLRTQDVLVRAQAERARLGRVAGYEVPVVNWGAHHSELLAHLLDLFPDAPFVAGYADMASIRHWSLRTRKDRGVDVSLLAERLGGGGHSLAAGFEEPLPPTSYGPAILDETRSESGQKKRKSA